MNYREREVKRFRDRTGRFLQIIAKSAPAQVLEQEGALVIASVIRVAGPQAMAKYAEGYLRMGHENEGLCPEDHADDRSLHPIFHAQLGICLECVVREAMKP